MANDKSLRSPSVHGIPPKIRKRKKEAHKEVLQTNEVRERTTRVCMKVMVPPNTCEATEVRKLTTKTRKELLAPLDLRKWIKMLRNLKIGDRVKVTNNYKGPRGTICVITILSPEQAYVMPDNGKSEFRRHKLNLKIMWTSNFIWLFAFKRFIHSFHFKFNPRANFLRTLRCI